MTALSPIRMRVLLDLLHAWVGPLPARPVVTNDPVMVQDKRTRAAYVLTSPPPASRRKRRK